MNTRNEWKKYKYWYIKDRIINIISRKMFHNEIQRLNTRSGKHPMSKEEFNMKLMTVIDSENPFMIARYGSVEATALFMGLGVRAGAIKRVPDECIKQLHLNAGFFPINESAINRYIDVMQESSKQIDILGYWNTGYQEYLVDKCCTPDLKITDLSNFQPYQAKDNNVWTAALEGKKVLIIHPFAETIENQYKKRELLWSNPYILPDFELRTVKAVQTIAGQKDSRFKDWFKALDYMTEEALKEDFDLAVIACGAYGMPLAANLKKEGKRTLHWGGISQIWFGIKGGRWDDNPKINQFYNDAWVRPSSTETPSGKSVVEGGCYW